MTDFVQFHSNPRTKASARALRSCHFDFDGVSTWLIRTPRCLGGAIIDTCAEGLATFGHS